ncbi:aminotransferase class V-fold PLP-dependent enzyme [bacterium]|nr:aminotransferase class V-fold PLP-dependent enzyme [bacterium]
MLSCQAHRFSLDRSIHYLNCAYMSPLPIPVEEAGIKGILGKRNPHLVSTSDFFETASSVRSLFADLVSAHDASSISILPAVSYGTAIAAKNVTVRPGQNIVLVHEQFPSNVYVWTKLAAERQLTVRIATPALSASGATNKSVAWTHAVLESIDSDTAVVALPTVHWTDGTLLDLVKIGQRAREVGAYLIVDGTQSVGALPFDIRLIQPDALIVAGYKWMMGPYSCGLAYWGERLIGGQPLEENWINRLNSENFASLVDYEERYQPGAVRFDVGEKSNFILLPMLEAALQLLLEWKPARVQTYLSELVRPWVQPIRDLGFVLDDESSRGAHLFGIKLPSGMDPMKLKEDLDSKSVSVSVRGKAIRVAPHVYNDHDDLAAFVDALKNSIAK